MDERLVVPKELRPFFLRSLHYGHLGRDSKLSTVSNVWWPRLHREVVGIANLCHQCQIAGKNIKTILNQKQVGELPIRKEANQEIAIDFVGPFQNAIGAKKYLLVSIDHFTAWPETKFLRKPNTEKDIEFLKKYIARHGCDFKEFCRKRYIEHLECPIKDHKGNGKIERLIRAINERFRTNKEVVIKRGKSGLSEILFALRMNPSAKKNPRTKDIPEKNPIL